MMHEEAARAEENNRHKNAVYTHLLVFTVLWNPMHVKHICFRRAGLRGGLGWGGRFLSGTESVLDNSTNEL